MTNEEFVEFIRDYQRKDILTLLYDIYPNYAYLSKSERRAVLPLIREGIISPETQIGIYRRLYKLTESGSSLVQADIDREFGENRTTYISAANLRRLSRRSR